MWQSSVDIVGVGTVFVGQSSMGTVGTAGYRDEEDTAYLREKPECE